MTTARTATSEDEQARLCRLVEEYPSRMIAWFAVGCYYLCTAQYDSARTYLGKATQMDATFAPAWLVFAHAFALQDESDQVQP